jgi:septum formation protein
VVPEVDELTEGDPETTVLENARRKARAGTTATAEAGDLVLGVDTEVVLDGRLLGKAGDEEEARERLSALSGRTHEVLSGLVLLTQSASRPEFVRSEGTDQGLGEGRSPWVPGAERSGVARSRVTFREVDAGLIDKYIASGEWRDRAGGYAVQGLGSALVVSVDGDLSNVIGLPVSLLLELGPDLPGNAGGSLPDGGLGSDSKV